jgi:DNA-directed RNA polymerase subunit beta
MAPAKDRPVRRLVLGGAARQSFARVSDVPMPNLNDIQRESFDWFLKEGLKEVFAEFSPLANTEGE